MTIERLTLNDPDAQSADTIAANIAALKALFPAAVADGRIDFDTLRQVLGDEVDDGDERYGLNWPGKRRARRLALTPSTGTLRPAREDSVNWDSTRNLMIEGDNLEVLKLLQKTYAGKVKLIYIDPPYNTGNDFVYEDDYADPLSDYLCQTGQVSEAGVRTTTNLETSGRYHSAWLSMMLPRLMLARTLLGADGVFFASCDDNEVDHFRAILDEVFGEQNRIAIICHKSRASVSNDKIISSNHNFVLCYAREAAAVFARRSEFGLEPDLTGFDKTDERGAYKYAPVDGPGGAAKGNPHYTFLDVTGYFRFSKDTMERLHREGRVVKVGNGLQQKYYLEDAKRSRKTDTTWWDHKLLTSTASSQLKDLMGADVFDSPKHLGLVRRMVQLWSRSAGDVVLDFFAGSGTTAQAVLEQSASDGVERNFMLVQLPQPLSPDDKDEATAARYCDNLGKPRNIAELTKERLRRAAAKVKADHPDTQADLGFRVYKLAASNLRAWEPGDDLAADLLAAADNIVQGRSEEDLLTELLLKQGIDLTEPMLTETIAGAPVHAMGGGVLVVCLAPVTAGNAEALADGIADWIEQLDPVAASTVFFKDAGFENDVAKANVAAILEQRLEDKLLKVRSL